MKTFPKSEADSFRCSCGYDLIKDRDQHKRNVYVEESDLLLKRKRGTLMLISQAACPKCQEYYWYFAKAPVKPKECIL